MIIALDFDGTICRGKYPRIEGLQPFAKEIISELHDNGHYLIINTCRSGDLLTEAINWLLQQEIPFNRVNDNQPEQSAIYNNNSRKIYAHVYIDDKNLGGFPGWLQAKEIINKTQEEYERSKK